MCVCVCVIATLGGARPSRMALPAASTYTPWDARVVAASLGAWYDVADLSEAIHALQHSNYQVQAQRDQALSRLGNLRVAAPFAQDIRFPSGRLFVHEGTGDWVSKFTRLRSVLSVKDLVKDDKVRGDSNPRATDLSDGTVSFYRTLGDFAGQIARLDGVHDRTRFEREYGLVWA